MKNNVVFRAWLIVAACLLSGTTMYAAEGKHQMGPTGIIGTVSKNVLTVTDVAAGSPADGNIKVKDRIIGVGSGTFKKDLRREMADAIDVAETEEVGGKLTLILKDNRQVVLELPVLGRYSETAPYDCMKTRKIVTRAADQLMKGKIGSVSKTDLLGLLATGEKEYLDFVTKYVHDTLAKEKYNEFNPDPVKMEGLIQGTEEAGYVCWTYGYTLIFLCEYYLLTGDEAVLPGIKTYAVTLARGQGPVGTYGHRLAAANLNFQIRGYGAMNQPSLTCIMGMFLAQKCGIKDPRLEAGAKRSYEHYAEAIGKCAFNYGTIGNTAAFNNNGTSGSAAVAMLVKGDLKGANFFSILSAASHGKIETGHTGHFFNMLWTPLGANLGGPELTKQFFEKTRWLQTLYRAFDGSFTFDGGSYKRCNSTGAHLLFYCTPRRNLYITGKGSEPIWLTPKQAKEAVNLDDIDYEKIDDDQLLRMAVEHPIPQIRRRSVGALSQKMTELHPRLLQYLTEGSDAQKTVVAQMCGWWVPDETKLPYLEGLIDVLRDTRATREARESAALAICYFKDKDKIQGYFMDVIRVMAESESSAEALIRGAKDLAGEKPLSSGLVTDREVFYKALLPILNHRDPKIRGRALKLLQDIPPEDFHIIADKVIWSLQNEDGSSSAHNPQHVVVPAIAILAHLNIAEGLEYAKNVRAMPGGKGSFKIKAFFKSLALYGPAAKPFIEENERFEKYGQKPKVAKEWRAMIQSVDVDRPPQKLITLEEAIKAGKHPPGDDRL
jgi:hypothetical protein